MIAILSPAKNLEFNRNIRTSLHSEPIFKEEAFELVEETRKYSPPELSSLMKISDELSELNFFRYVDWTLEHNITNSKQAGLAFAGAVYQGLKAEEFNDHQLEYAQIHLRILSGLYGVLRPLDIIQPYRLEMGTKLTNKKGKDLYAFWKEKITDYFNEELSYHKDNILLNLASKEYFSSIDINNFSGNVITPVFKEYRNGAYKNITIYAKRARGLMAKFIVENEIESIEELKRFEEEGYLYNEALSNDRELVFTRSII